MANRIREDMAARKEAIGQSIKTVQMVASLPKNENWMFDAAYVSELIRKLIDLCAENGIIPTANLMASALGVPRERETDVRMERVPCNPDVAHLLKEYFKLCENTTVQASLDGSANNIATIFLMKSMYGYQEQPKEIVVTHNYNKLLGDRKDPEAIAARYAESMVIDVDSSELKEIDETAIPDMASLPAGVVDKTKKIKLVDENGEEIVNELRTDG